MVLLIDNYDSFSYNLVQYIGELSDGSIKVVRNDKISIEQIREVHPTHIILSPGSGRPKDAGICKEVVNKLKSEYPILGVCLGHQCICENFGINITYAKKMMHGKKGNINILKDDEIFEGVDNNFEAARYHSLSADMKTDNDELELLAVDQLDNEVMAVKHKDYKIYGLQFHPESVLTPDGKKILNNFLKI
ncbi:MAG: aminodeoxychorismate/anthranilate synthase component II [Eubacterium sp.]|nr:aminodeoxychorismate/anthranilate synthase component II [Eubacterium sp.]